MSFDYEQSIWGRGLASTNPTNPTAIRLRNALLALSQLPAGAKVLELGCGAGQFIRAVKRERPDLECCGTDISEKALDEAREADGGVQYKTSKQNKLPYADGEFDAVLIFDVLEHVDSPSAIMREINRVLNKGGIFYGFVPCEGDITSLWHLLDAMHLKKNLTKRFAGHIQYFSRRQLFTLVQGAQFSIKKVSYSEHVLGQMVGVVAFMLMGRAARHKNVAQINNEDYFSEKKSSLYRIASGIVNALIYFESVFLFWVPSPNVHVVAKKL